MIEIYTDGSCDIRSRVGGWAYVLVEDETLIKDKKRGKELNTTNNRMELLAAIKALEDFSDQEITIFSDSKYLVNGMNNWVKSWQRINWTRRKEIKNTDLWKYLVQLTKGRKIKWLWIEGHSGNIFNEIADELARYDF